MVISTCIRMIDLNLLFFKALVHSAPERISGRNSAVENGVASLMHALPHYDWHLQPAPVSFQPLDSLYQQVCPHLPAHASAFGICLISPFWCTKPGSGTGGFGGVGPCHRSGAAFHPLIATSGVAASSISVGHAKMEEITVRISSHHVGLNCCVSHPPKIILSQNVSLYTNFMKHILIMIFNLLDFTKSEGR